MLHASRRLKAINLLNAILIFLLTTYTLLTYSFTSDLLLLHSFVVCFCFGAKFP